MKLVLDTHAFIWWDSDPSQLSGPAVAALRDPANEVWLSVASVWEMVIKAQLGKLALRLPLAAIVAQQANGLQLLTVNLAHALAVEGLPPLHKDPFDRLLITDFRRVRVPPLASRVLIGFAERLHVRWILGGG